MDSKFSMAEWINIVGIVIVLIASVGKICICLYFLCCSSCCTNRVGDTQQKSNQGSTTSNDIPPISPEPDSSNPQIPPPPLPLLSKHEEEDDYEYLDDRSGPIQGSSAKNKNEDDDVHELIDDVPPPSPKPGSQTAPPPPPPLRITQQKSNQGSTTSNDSSQTDLSNACLNPPSSTSQLGSTQGSSIKDEVGGDGSQTLPTSPSNLSRKPQQKSNQGSTTSNDKNELENEFKSLKNFYGNEPSKYPKDQFGRLCRYTDIYPSDSSVPELKSIFKINFPDGEPIETSYINASEIKFGDDNHTYIATQGPLPYTWSQFWFMCWEKNVPMIVMLCNTIESDKQKCYSYFPDEIGKIINTEGNINEERIEIKCIKCEKVYNQAGIDTGIIYRTFKMIFHRHEETQEKIIKQIHFKSWADHKAIKPEAMHDLLNCYRKYTKDETGPTVVHCSAGVGRTGTFIACDFLKRHNKKGKENVDDCIKQMRNCRSNMVQTFEQYSLIINYLQEDFEN